MVVITRVTGNNGNGRDAHGFGSWMTNLKLNLLKILTNNRAIIYNEKYIFRNLDGGIRIYSSRFFNDLYRLYAKKYECRPCV